MISLAHGPLGALEFVGALVFAVGCLLVLLVLVGCLAGAVLQLLKGSGY